MRRSLREGCWPGVGFFLVKVVFKGVLARSERGEIFCSRKKDALVATTTVSHSLSNYPFLFSVSGTTDIVGTVCVSHVRNRRPHGAISRRALVLQLIEPIFETPYDFPMLW